MGDSRTAWCADYWQGECLPGVVVERSYIPSQPYEIAKNGEKTGVYPAMCLARKLVGPAGLNAVAAGQLAHMLDQTSDRRFLVDTGSSFSILPFSSSLPATGPSHRPRR